MVDLLTWTTERCLVTDSILTCAPKSHQPAQTFNLGVSQTPRPCPTAWSPQNKMKNLTYLPGLERDHNTRSTKVYL
jgi:hypothetical protein